MERFHRRKLEIVVAVGVQQVFAIQAFNKVLIIARMSVCIIKTVAVNLYIHRYCVLIMMVMAVVTHKVKCSLAAGKIVIIERKQMIFLELACPVKSSLRGTVIKRYLLFLQLKIIMIL